MATSRDYNTAVNGRDIGNTSARTTDRTNIHHILQEVGLNPSDYIFSPLPQNSSAANPTFNQSSAFSNYPQHPPQDNRQILKPQSQTVFTASQPPTYVQQPAPPPPPPPINRDQAPPRSQPSNNQQQGFPAPYNQQSGAPPSQSGPSALFNLFNPSGSSSQNQGSQAPPPPPPPTQSAPQGGSSALLNLFNSSGSNSQNQSSQPPPSGDMSQHIFSPRRLPPSPPPHDSSLSAQYYLHQINSQENPPVRVVKPNTQNVVYRKEIRVRYLQPPTPPPPAPIIIREKRIPPNPPPSPLLIRERKPEARTPPPLTIRERPPTPPPRLEPYVIEKNLPPPPPLPRQIIVERLPTPPPKPRTVIFEKWLPYKKVKRPVLLQKAPPPEPIRPVRNVVIEYEPLKAVTVRRVIEEGVFRVDPHQYLSYNSQSHAGGGDVRVVERIDDLPPPSAQLMHVLNEYRVPVQPSSSHLTSYDHYSHHGSSELIPPNIQHLLTGARSTSYVDQLTNVSHASNTPAYLHDRVLSPGYHSSGPSPVTVVPIQRSYSKSSNHAFRQITPQRSPTRSHIDDIY